MGVRITCSMDVLAMGHREKMRRKTYVEQLKGRENDTRGKLMARQRIRDLFVLSVCVNEVTRRHRTRTHKRKDSGGGRNEGYIGDGGSTGEPDVGNSIQRKLRGRGSNAGMRRGKITYAEVLMALNSLFLSAVTFSA
jgi:hypothetical protein